MSLILIVLIVLLVLAFAAPYTGHPLPGGNLIGLLLVLLLIIFVVYALSGMTID